MKLLGKGGFISYSKEPCLINNGGSWNSPFYYFTPKPFQITWGRGRRTVDKVDGECV